MQYVWVRPGTSLSLYLIYVHLMYWTVITVVGIICQRHNVLCASGPYSVHFAEVYLDVADLVSVRYVDLTMYLLYVDVFTALRNMVWSCSMV